MGRGGVPQGRHGGGRQGRAGEKRGEHRGDGGPGPAVGVHVCVFGRLAWKGWETGRRVLPGPGKILEWPPGRRGGAVQTPL